MRSFQHHGLHAVRRVISGIDLERTVDEPICPLQVGCGVWALYPGNTRAVISRELDQRTHVARINAQRPFTECQSACKFDPVSASNFDPFERRVLTVALVSSELAGIAETR